MKTCSKCEVPKDGSCFHRSTSLPSGLQSECRDCRKKERSRRSKDPIVQERVSRYNREWTKNNPGYRREYVKNKYHTDPSFKMSVLLRRRLSESVTRKGARTMELLGCPIVWLEVHLESLFKPGMSWDNHGPVWHIDHIKPCSAFDLTDLEQQKICFHWTNLQPLFALENKRKSDSYHG